VGNSGILRRTAYGPSIDGHDSITRINHAPPHSAPLGPSGGCPLTVGTRTDIRVLSSYWLHKYAHSLDVGVGSNVTFVVAASVTKGARRLGM
jgi:hypothetical protein